LVAPVAVAYSPTLVVEAPVLLKYPA